MKRSNDRAPSPARGAVVPPLDWHRLAHELITQRKRATKLDLVPLADRYRDALRWRLARLLPIVAAPTYAELWQRSDATRLALFEAIFQSGDFHYGDALRLRRQTIARWLHARLTIASSPTKGATELKEELGGLV